eukprot:2710741-Amphidinium_carterae.1
MRSRFADQEARDFETFSHAGQTQSANRQPAGAHQLVCACPSSYDMAGRSGECHGSALALCHTRQNSIEPLPFRDSALHSQPVQLVPSIDSHRGCLTCAGSHVSSAGAFHSTHAVAMRASQWHTQKISRRQTRSVPQVHGVHVSMEVGPQRESSTMEASTRSEGGESSQERGASKRAVTFADIGCHVSDHVHRRGPPLEDFLPPARQLRRGWQRELGVLRKVQDTYALCSSVMQQHWIAKHQAHTPTVVIGGTHGLIPLARKAMTGTVRIAHRDDDLAQVEDQVGLFVLSSADKSSQRRALQLLSAPWLLLGLVVVTELAHALHQLGALLEYRLQRCGDEWMWIMSDPELALPPDDLCHHDIGTLINAAIQVVESRRQELGSQRQSHLQEGPIPHTVPVPGHQVLWQDANKNVEDWREVLEEAEVQLKARSAVGQWEPPADGSWRQKLSQLVLWRLEKVCAVLAPKVRRLPSSFPYTHRGAAVVFNDDSTVIETEELDANTVPRLRFSKPVRFAILFYGVSLDEQPIAREEPGEGQPGEPPRAVPGDSVKIGDGIFFRVDRHKVPVSVCQLVYKLHTQLGHLPKGELAKLLASHGANPITLTAVAGLDCATCNRQKTVPPSRPSSAPQTFSFGESLQGDIFFVMDTLGENHAILGIIDAATHLHVARRVTSKNALDMWKVFLDVWISPFGVPVELKVDADPAFRGTFGENCGRLGIELLHIPADRHAQLGRIERHNAVLRVALIKMISEHSAHTIEHMETLLQAAVSAKNSLTRRAGVSPHIAAFGRMPRVPEQLLSDDHNAHLHQSLTADQQVRRAMRLRLSAQKTFLEVQQMEALRSAILRKQPPPSASSYTPGERIAYYRTKALTRRGHRSKRSGYIAATFVALDSGPRGRSQNAWVLAGGRLVLVDIAQLRPAVGFENW